MWGRPPSLALEPPDRLGEETEMGETARRPGEGEESREQDPACAGEPGARGASDEPKDREELAGDELEHSGAYGGAQGEEGERALGLDDAPDHEPGEPEHDGRP
jgi:hypothetical protein